MDVLSYFFKKSCFLDDYKNELSGKSEFLENFSGLNEGKLENFSIITISCPNIDQVPEFFLDDWPHVAIEWVIRGRL